MYSLTFSTSPYNLNALLAAYHPFTPIINLLNTHQLHCIYLVNIDVILSSNFEIIKRLVAQKRVKK